MEVSLAIRKGYFDALNGNVSYNSVDLGIYDAYAVPEDVAYPYILLSSQVESQRLQKDCKTYDANILIDVVTGDLNPIGRQQSEEIADQIEDIINPDSRVNIDIESDGYKIGSTNRLEGSDLTAKNNQYYVFRKLIRYQHIICKI